MNAGWTRDAIIEEIGRLYRRIGQTPGKESFQRETGIPKSYWEGGYWATWDDLVADAGLRPNQVPQKISDNELREHYAQAVRHFGRIPSEAKLRMYKAQTIPDFPREAIRKRFVNKQSRNAALWKFVQENSQFADLIDLVPEPKDDDSAANRSELHRIQPDDPPGIETYCHSRFADKKTNSEWFALSPLDVRAFKRRRRFQ